MTLMQTVWFSQHPDISWSRVLICGTSAGSADSKIMCLRPLYFFNDMTVERITQRQLTDTPECQMTLVFMTVM